MMKGYYRTKNTEPTNFKSAQFSSWSYKFHQNVRGKQRDQLKKKINFTFEKEKWSQNLKILTSTPTETRPSTKTDQCIDAF